MRFPKPLIEARLVQRYKRFLADVVLADGTAVTAHCANPGAMLGLNAPGSRVLLSICDSRTRKLPHSWELVEAELPGGPQWVGINTMRPNALVAEAFAAGKLAPLAGYTTLRPEVAYGKASRVDFLATGEGMPPCHVEVKNCHLLRQPGLAEFPDCKAARSARHMAELAEVVASGGRAILITVVQMAADAFDIARDIDPAFDRAFRAARAAGVEVHAYRCRITPEEVAIADAIPVVTPA
ncbi:DNA/RNA nuclease SfsA [Methylobacterium gnaphalii]|uniref:Sugar fermentation stimulation protein homolog n=1 Tax=Methylobacterium gnaphalii TaxID=1010610 RepID=A0A512JQX0_9HYPH|nr:DNA/RNA nuclease SfsA [Methylobacterium gnaphalii]GEP12355.1 sugar fermentation stimulation protein [Methylobacterium gnaphalii]GJD71265.1 Sugar fermentation stimulation protein A [Methylobacterium gnaphalii]GLS48566.1 sugar fermentation stimulation protein [Methylobacterium gnaphalii]